MEKIVKEYVSLLPKNLCVNEEHDLTPREKAFLLMLKKRDDDIKRLVRMHFEGGRHF